MNAQSSVGVPTAVELFAGAGGMALGCHRAGFKHLALLELDENAVGTLLANQGEHSGIQSALPIESCDVRGFDFEQIHSAVDLLAAGAPCQPFSLGGKHRGRSDSRNLFPEVFRAQRDLRPKAVLLENVRGLARKSFRPYLEYLLLQLALPGIRARLEDDWQVHKRSLLDALQSGETGGRPAYHVSFASLNCADFGVPQRRHRVFMVAIRTDLGLPFEWPAPTHSREALLYSQFVSGDYWKRHGIGQPEGSLRGERIVPQSNGLRPWVTVRDALEGVPEPVMEQSHPHHPNHVGVPGARAYPGHTGSPFDEPSKTLKAGVHGVPGGENMIRYTDGTLRYLTVHEAGLIQTFPAEYVFVGSRTEAMRQIGNAAPVRVGEVIARAIIERLRPPQTIQSVSSGPRVALIDDRPLALV